MDICLGANWSTHTLILYLLYPLSSLTNAFNIVTNYGLFTERASSIQKNVQLKDIYRTIKYIYIYSLKCTFLGIKSLKKMKRNWYCENIHAIKSLLDWPFCRITDLSIITSFRVCFFFPVTIFSNLKKKVSGITRKFAHTFF